MNSSPLISPEPRGFYCGWKAFVLVGLALLAYINMLNNELFLDDLDFIVNNVYLQDWRYLPQIFTHSVTAGAGKASDYYRPAIEVVFSAGYHLWALNPMGYHLLSVAFHSASALLLYGLLSGLVGPSLAFWTAVLFAVHPVQTEAVDSASALGILMGCFLGLAALRAQVSLRQGNPGGWSGLVLRAGAWLCAALVLLCKETMVVLPGYVFLLEYSFLSGKEGWRRRLGDALRQAAPYLAISAVYILLRFTVLNFGGTGNLYRGENIFTQHLSARFYTFLTVLVQFFQILFWPARLFMERGTVTPIYLSFWNMPVLAGFLLLAVPLGWALWLGFRPGPFPGRREWDWSQISSFGVFWFLIGLAPVSNILIPISTTIVESWLYMPMIGIVLIVIAGAQRFFGRRLSALLLSGLAAACLVGTWSQNRVWADPVTFYEHTLLYAPRSARFHNNLAMAYADRREYPKAIEQYQLAIGLSDQYPETHHNLANTYLALGRLGEAEKEFRRAIEMNPKFFHSYVALALFYHQQKLDEPARMVLEQLIANVPERGDGYYHLGLLYFSKGDREKAVELWKQGLKADPYDPALNAAVRSVE